VVADSKTQAPTTFTSGAYGERDGLMQLRAKQIAGVVADVEIR